LTLFGMIFQNTTMRSVILISINHQLIRDIVIIDFADDLIEQQKMINNKRVYVVFILVLLFFSSYADGQNLDSIKQKDVFVSGYKLGSMFEPTNIDSVQKHFDPIIDNDTLFYYYFGKSYLEVKDSKVIGFNIVDSHLNLKKFNIGDNVNEIKERFPNSFNQKYSIPEDNVEIAQIQIVANNIRTDSYIRLYLINNIVSRIYYWFEY